MASHTTVWHVSKLKAHHLSFHSFKTPPLLPAPDDTVAKNKTLFRMDFSQPGLPQMAAVIRGKEPATSLSFHSSGNLLFVASERDQRLRLIDCNTGTSDKPAIRFERQGIRLVEST